MKWEETPEIHLYSDGGAEPNPGTGGFGVVMSYKGHKKEFSQGFRLTTNNRMELMGVIHGLERLKTKSIVRVYSDSRYVVDGITEGWAEKWKSNNWYRTKTELAVNWDLWDRLLILISRQQEVTFNWIRGHVGHPENERCDELANMAIHSEQLLEDNVYEENVFKNTGFEIHPAISMPTVAMLNEQNKNQNTKSRGKIKKEGDPCRKCGNAVILKPTKKREIKPNQRYYFEYYFLCKNCKTMYMVEEAKRFV